MVIFVIYLASNQSSHFQKISQMNVLNAINIGLTVKPIHRNHVFGMTVFYQFQITGNDKGLYATMKRWRI